MPLNTKEMVGHGECNYEPTRSQTALRRDLHSDAKYVTVPTNKIMYEFAYAHVRNIRGHPAPYTT
jgi:hypothetical protein